MRFQQLVPTAIETTSAGNAAMPSALTISARAEPA